MIGLSLQIASTLGDNIYAYYHYEKVRTSENLHALYLLQITTLLSILKKVANLGKEDLLLSRLWCWCWSSCRSLLLFLAKRCELVDNLNHYKNTDSDDQEIETCLQE